MLQASLNCPYLSAQCSKYLWIVHSSLPNFASVSGLSIRNCHFRFSLTFKYHVCVLCSQCCQYLWNVNSALPLSVFSNVYLSCVLCAQCCQCLWNVYSWSLLRFFLTFICPVTCVPNIASVSGLSIRNFPFRCFLTSIFPVSFLLVQTYRPSGTDIFWNKILQSNMISFSRFLDFTIENRKCKSKQWVNNTYFSPVNFQSDSRHHWKSLR